MNKTHKHKIAYDYCQAMLTQSIYTDKVSKAFQVINLDNQVFGLADPVEAPYTKLVEELLGTELFDWIMWWMYECEHGTKAMQFTVDGIEHDPTTMTLYKFLELVDANA